MTKRIELFRAGPKTVHRERFYWAKASSIAGLANRHLRPLKRPLLFVFLCFSPLPAQEQKLDERWLCTAIPRKMHRRKMKKRKFRVAKFLCFAFLYVQEQIQQCAVNVPGRIQGSNCGRLSCGL